MYLVRKINSYFLYGELFIMFSMCACLSASASDSTVQQNIRYYTSRTREMNLIWTIDDWKLPTAIFFPKGSYVKDGMVYSKMNFNEDHFSIRLDLPKGTYINYMFWATKDSVGNNAEGWDTNWGSNYNTLIDGDGKDKIIEDSKLDFVKTESKSREFDILKNGKQYLLICLGLLLVCFIGYFLMIRKRKLPLFKIQHVLVGICISFFFLTILIRLQMNGYIFNKQYLLFGVSFYDLLFLSIVAGLFFGLIYISTKYRVLQAFVSIVFLLLLIGLTVFNLFNIEIVRQLGHPINYKWLYYSDFLKATDAKNALKANLNTGLNTNLILIVIGVLVLGYAFSLIIQFYQKRSPKLVPAFALLVLIFLGLGFYQVKKLDLEHGKIANPVMVLGQSWLEADKEPGIFSKKIDSDILKRIESMHEAEKLNKVNYADSIKNIILFVLESTPHSKVQVYDSTFKVTSNLSYWSKQALIFDNMYAHIPNTVSSMFSICTGRYPMISYKAFINEYPTHPLETLPAILKDNGWNTSLFFSSDLTYSNIGKFTESHGFERSEDMKTIKCDVEKFESNFAQLDGLDDRCIVNRYFNWKDSLNGKKNFSVIWTNQTHYPYFSKDNVNYSEVPELNKFLNGLKNVDEAFGSLMSGLKQRGELNNTLVIVVGDHGEAFGTHNQFSHGSRIYEENLRIPCFIVNPIMFEGSRDGRLGGLIDIAPTILHFTGIQQPVNWQGNSLLANKNRSHVFMVGPFSDFLLGSRFGKWKFIYNIGKEEFELYDLKDDPFELRNIAKYNSELIEKEYKFLLGWAQYQQKSIKKLLNRNK